MLTEWLADALGYCGGGELASDRLLPYFDHLRPDVMLLADGSVLGMVRMPGAPYALLSHRQRNANKRRHLAVLNAVADGNVELFEHLVRHDAVPPLPPRGGGDVPYARQLLADYHATLDGELRRNDWFLSLRIKPRRFSARIPFVRQTADPAETDDLVRQLEDSFRLICRTLRAERPGRLGIRTDAEGVEFSEIAEALYLIRTTRFLPQALVEPVGAIGAALYTDDVICGRRGFEIRHAPGGTDSTFGAMLGWRVYPRQINIARFDELLSLDCNFVLTNALAYYTRAEAQDALALLKRQMETAEDAAVTDTEALADAIDAVASGRGERGLGRWSLAIHGRTPADVDRAVSEAKTIIANAGPRVAVEGIGTFDSYWAQLPGSRRRHWIRPASLRTKPFTAFSSLAGFATGTEAPRWDAHLFRMATAGTTAFSHDQFCGGVGHMTVIAPNGAGKTVFVGMSIAALDGLVRPKGGTQIVLDVDESNAQVIMALGGDYVPIRAGEDSGVALLRGLPDTPRSRHMLRGFIAGLVQEDGGAAPTQAERRGIADGVDFVMGEVPPDQRRFATIRRFMGYGENGAGERFEPWCQGGDMGHVFDGDRHLLDFTRGLVGVDLTEIMNDKRIMPPMATALLWLASEVMDGRRCVVWAEEAPAYLPEPRFASVFKGIALRARKRNAAFIAVAQMPEHLLQNEAGKAIIKQSRQMVLLPNDGAERADYMDGLGCTEAEFEAVREGMFRQPHRSVLVKRSDGQSDICRFDLSALPKHLAVLSSTPISVALMRRCIGNHPDNRQAALDEFWCRLPDVAP